jgi:chromosomal replication initiator protein
MTGGEWQRIRERLRVEYGESAFRSWLALVLCHRPAEQRVELRVQSRFVRDWIDNHYADRIRDLWVQENPEVTSVDIVVEDSVASQPGGADDVAVPTAPASPLTSSTSLARPLGAEAGADNGHRAVMAADDYAGLDPRFTFDTFVGGKSNELALAAARRVADSDNVPFNPLFLYGGVGLGKTHLMHAMAHQIRHRQPHKSILYMSAEKFMYEFIRAIRFKDTMVFKQQFRSVDVLMIDDVQFISGKDSTQEEFFHTFNALVDQKRQVVISADKSPSDLNGMEERLRSRLGWGLVADIHPTSYELRLGILDAKADRLTVKIPRKVMELLAHRITSNVRELEGALNRLVAHAQLVGRQLTIESAQDLLRDLLRANDRRVSIEEIQKRVAEHYSIRVAEMYSVRRARNVARPRQIAMYLTKRLTEKSLPEIGRKFGGRDHTTVMHAIRKVEELIASDAAFSEDVDLLQRILEGGR